jgi:hypothetical protein
MAIYGRSPLDRMARLPQSLVDARTLFQNNRRHCARLSICLTTDARRD